MQMAELQIWGEIGDATAMVERGVFSSWVILFIKSFLISESFFCFKIIKIVIEKVIRMINVSRRDPASVQAMDLSKCTFLPGN